MGLENPEAIAKLSNNNINYNRQCQCNKIISMYLEYLWEKSSRKTDLRYVNSFESWVDKNKHMWGEDLSTPTESLNLFMEEHKEVINLFKQIEEPGLIYLLCLKEKESHCKSESLLGTIINGLGGTSKTT